MAPSPFLPSPPPSPSKTSATPPAMQTTKKEASDADKDGNATNATHPNVHAAINPMEEAIPAGLSYEKNNNNHHNHNHNRNSINNNNINEENNDFLSQAIRAHKRLFQTHVQTTLHHASSQYLHRLLTHRLRVHLEENFTTQELLSRHPSVGDDDDIRDALTLLASKPLPVRKEDVDEAYALAGRIGEKWAEVLFREGYDELADVVRGVVTRGRFLEWSSRESDDEQGRDGGKESKSEESPGLEGDDNRPHGREDDGDALLLPYSKLTSLRRYPPDCDGSGRPMRYLPIRDVDEPSSSSVNDAQTLSSARNVIRQIDSLAEKGETMWNYGWDVILEAVERNRRRKRRRRGAKSYGDPDWEEGYEVVPKDSSIGFPCNYTEDEDYDHDDNVMSVEGVEEDDDEDDDGVADSKTKHRKKNETYKKSVTFPSSIKACNNTDETNNKEIIDKDFLISTHKISAAVMSQRERQEMMRQSLDDLKGNRDDANDNDQKVDDEADDIWEVPQERGRPPSTLEWEQWTLEDVRNCMTKEERKELVRLAIHPPYPYERDGNDDRDAIVSRAENMDGATGDADQAATTNVDQKPIAGHSNNKAKEELVKATEEEEPPPKAILCGALKPLGSIHLWEETRHLSNASSPFHETPYENSTAPTMPTLNKARTPTQPDDSIIYGAAEAVSEHKAERLRRRRAKALRKATKERIGYRVPKLSEEKVERGCGASSKAVWTRGEAHEQKEGGGGRGRSGGGADVGRSGGLGQVLGEDEKQMWLELDLGECVMETTVDDDDDDDDNGKNDATHNNNGHGKKRKRMMAFRSVEIALKNWPIQITKSM